MMAGNDLSDDYVAGLLAKDAKESSIKYSTVGLEAFASSSSKPPANKPKPNTRFLRNIIKDTDSHNAALLAKEAADSRARLQSLATKDQREGKGRAVGGVDIRRRQLGDIAAILGGRSNKRKRVEEKPREELRRKNSPSSNHEPEHKSRSRNARDQEPRAAADEDERSRKHRSRHRRQRSTSLDRGRKDERRKRHRSRSRSPTRHGGKESKYRERSPGRRRSRSAGDDESREKSHRSHRRKRSVSDDQKSSIRPAGGKNSSSRAEAKPDYDSDPLDEIIGPKPPPIQQVRTRGRGTISHESGIDSRFSANYDPTTDVQLDPDEENDWDQALEALRDRQKWKQQGADRLKAAGFTDEEIKKWEKGGEKREEDVTWTKKGESREWDRGKVVDGTGAVTIESKFGRLTD